MCGIFGKVDFSGGPVEPELVRKMGAVIRHRGPDEAGYHFSPGVGMGIARLSIIDLRQGLQPVYNEDRTKVIVFNGEIYNFQELRSELEGRGHEFRTRTDTEAIIHLYEEMGRSCVDRLRGMFAFAIWDLRERSLFVARDRFGEKPLFYARVAGGLVFGSELKALLADPSVERELDWGSVGDFLRFGYVLAPGSVFKGVKKLMPGCSMTVDGGGVRLERYWRYRLESHEDRGIGYYAEALRGQLQEAVGNKLVSDVPLGAFLSGGIDSSTVVALMSRAADQPVRAFSIGFEEQSHNELPYARIVSESFGAKQREYVLRPDAVGEMERIVWHLDEPFADASAIPTYFVSKVAREEVTVVLSGDGADELFAGYPGYAAELWLNRVRSLPGPVTEAAAAVAAGFRLPGAGGFNRRMERLARILERVRMSPEERFLSRHRVFTDDERRRLVRPELQSEGFVKQASAYADGLVMPGDEDPVNRMLLMDAGNYLANDMLVKVDRMSMAHSLEVRAPFLDHVLAEFVCSIPPWHKSSGGATKLVLKQAMRGILPDSVLDRPKKGFSVPLETWFRGDLEGSAASLLLDGRTARRGYFDMDEVSRILKAHRDGAGDMSDKIWTLMVFEQWCRLYLDGGSVH